jgi:hypothetical protein
LIRHRIAFLEAYRALKQIGREGRQGTHSPSCQGSVLHFGPVLLRFRSSSPVSFDNHLARHIN